MVRENEVRVNEVQGKAPEPADAGLTFIGCISTPWTSRIETPRQGRHDGSVCRFEIYRPCVAAPQGINPRQSESPVIALGKANQKFKSRDGHKLADDIASREHW